MQGLNSYGANVFKEHRRKRKTNNKKKYLGRGTFLNTGAFARIKALIHIMTILNLWHLIPYELAMFNFLTHDLNYQFYDYLSVFV